MFVFSRLNCLKFKREKKIILMITVDLQGAYDRVKTNESKNILMSYEIPIDLIVWINNLQINKK